MGRERKSFGQIFLKNKKYINRIISSLDVEKKDVLEIGAGRGELTRYLVEKARYLYCIEIDSKLVQILQEKFGKFPHIEVIKSDILKFDLRLLNRKMQVVGNIPFNISQALIRYLVKNREFVEQVYLTLQREFADKLVASAGRKAYSFLSCYIQFFAQVEKLFDIPRSAFSPPPEVDASFVKITFSSISYPVKDVSFLFRLIRRAFSQRRKKLINSLAGLYPRSGLQEVFLKLGFKEEWRAEDLSLHHYCQLTNCILEHSKDVKKIEVDRERRYDKIRRRGRYNSMN